MSRGLSVVKIEWVAKTKKEPVVVKIKELRLERERREGSSHAFVRERKGQRCGWDRWAESARWDDRMSAY